MRTITSLLPPSQTLAISLRYRLIAKKWENTVIPNELQPVDA
jgi:hypothetical protein